MLEQNQEHVAKFGHCFRSNFPRSCVRAISVRFWTFVTVCGSLYNRLPRSVCQR